MRVFALAASLFLSAIVACASPLHQQPTGQHGNTGRPSPLPPEPTHTLLGRASASNITVPTAPQSAPASPPSPVPTPMDLSVSYAFSSSCLMYLTSVLSSTTFKSCVPFSLLLTTSTSYSRLLSSSLASGDLSTLNQLLAYASSPQPSGDQCDQYFAGVLSALSSKANCAADFSTKNGNVVPAIAKDAQAGIGNYKAMREAAGLIDPDTGAYCYLEAVGSNRPDDLYLWSIPAGVSVPSTIQPTCSKCSGLLLNHFSESLDSTSTLNGTILSQAINTVNGACGSAFATYHAEATSSASGPLVASPSVLVALAIIAATLSVLVL